MARSNRDTFTRSNSRGNAWRAASVLAALTVGFAVFAQGPDGALRVCADPSNLPLSNERGEGYENKIAELLARDLKRHVEFTFFPQRMGFVRNTLRQKDETTQQFKCDVIIGVPKGFELTATTQPYMRSTYALVFKARDEFAQLQGPEDLMKLPPARLQQLRIGVFGRSPGADWLLRNGLLSHAVFYAPQSGDPAESTAYAVERDLLEGKTDMAIVWGPIAGFLVGQHQDSPAWRALPFKPDPTIKFDYEISMGVRFGEKEWKETLDQWIRTHHDEVRSILSRYHVPLLDINES
ncbi:MAG TPA: quinoprotein dehydrogenase-associated putative ABC transporter substrate-binding protein [Steroidobacteraceae bacterium]